MKDIHNMTMEEYAFCKVEDTRRALIALDAQIERGTAIAHELSEILVKAIHEVEILAERQWED